MEYDADTDKVSYGALDRRGARRIGYAVTIVVYLVSIWVARNLVSWGWPSFLTEEWDRAVPYITAAIGVSLVITVVYFWYDPEWYRALTQVIANIANFVATIAVWRIWPFEFSDGGFPWEPVVYVGITIGIFGAIIGVVSQSLKLVRALGDLPVRMDVP